MSRDHEDPAVAPAELDRLRAIVGRLDDEDSARVDPPVELWGRIAAAVASDADADATPAGAYPPVVETSRPEPVVAVVSLDAHRRRRHRRVLAAVAAVVVVAAMTVAVLTRGGSSRASR